MYTNLTEESEKIQEYVDLIKEKYEEIYNHDF